MAEVRSVGSTRNAYGTLLFSIRLAPADGVTLAASVASPSAFGTAVTFMATATGSSGYSYRFSLSADGGATYAQVRDWSATNTWTMPGTQALGSYRVFVEVRTSALVARDVYATRNHIVRETPPATLTLAADKVSPQPNTVAVLFTATATGTTFPVSYRFSVSTNGGATYTPVDVWGPANTFTLEGRPAGTFHVLVEARTSTLVYRDRYAVRAFTLTP